MDIAINGIQPVLSFIDFYPEIWYHNNSRYQLHNNDICQEPSAAVTDGIPGKNKQP